MESESTAEEEEEEESNPPTDLAPIGLAYSITEKTVIGLEMLESHAERNDEEEDGKPVPGQVEGLPPDTLLQAYAQLQNEQQNAFMMQHGVSSQAASGHLDNITTRNSLLPQHFPIPTGMYPNSLTQGQPQWQQSFGNSEVTSFNAATFFSGNATYQKAHPDPEINDRLALEHDDTESMPSLGEGNTNRQEGQSGAQSINTSSIPKDFPSSPFHGGLSLYSSTRDPDVGRISKVKVDDSVHENIDSCVIVGAIDTPYGGEERKQSSAPRQKGDEYLPAQNSNAPGSVPPPDKNSSGALKKDDYAESGMLGPWSAASAALLGDLALESQEVSKKSRKKPRDRPKRPLSAYNIFFKEERQRILGEIPDIHPGSVELGQGSAKKGGSKKKPHGKIDFQSLAKTIGKRWQGLDTADAAVYKKKAENDMIRYKNEMAAYAEGEQGK